MHKRGFAFIFSLLLVLSISFVYAQDTTAEVLTETTDSTVVSDTSNTNSESSEIKDNEQDISSQGATSEKDKSLSGITAEAAVKELGNGGSINKIDRFFDKIFKSDADYSKERAAEIRTLIKEERYEEAKALLVEYEKSAQKFEKEVRPEDKEKTKRRSEVIRKAYENIVNDIPSEYRDDFNKISVTEKKIETAVEIAAKIKDLCETLAKIDPDQYSRTCKTGEDSPKWQKKLDKDLTEEQKKEAKVFIQVMTQCFKDATKCKCQDISVKAFADKCSEVAPLYVECQKGDKSKCEEADAKSEDIEELLPDYLQDIMAELDDEYSGAQFENHMPQECQEANAKTEKECMQIMVRVHSPEECIAALDSGKIKFENERQFRKECEEEMFKENAPQECIDAGIKDGRECGKFMFKESAPQECLDAGLTGDKSSDGKKCGEIMNKLQGNREDHQGPGRGFNFDCRKIEKSEDRLKCFDSAISSYKEGPDQGEGRQFNEDDFRKVKDKERQCADSCSSKDENWDFSNGECFCRGDEGEDEGREFRDDRGERRFEDRDDRGERFDPNRKMSEEDRKRFENEMRERSEQNGQRFEGPPNQEQFNNRRENQPSESQPPRQSPPLDSSISPPQENQPRSSSSDTGSSNSGSSSSGSSSGPGSGITGGVIADIAKDSKFLQYFFNK